MINRRRFLGATAVAGAWLARPDLAVPSLENRRLPSELERFVGTPEAISKDEDFWCTVQRAFTVDRSLIHLNTGGVCPTLASVQDAEQAYQREAYRRPFYAYFGDVRPQLELVRQRLSEQLGSEADELALTRNTSEGMEICQLGFGLKPGDEVLTTEHDYRRMIHTWEQRAAREGIVLRRVPVPVPLTDPGPFVDALEAAITAKTRLIMCCHMVDLTGQILPVQDISNLARRRGLPLLVDGAQTFGQLDFDLSQLPCDFFATSLHKWLLGPHGTGLLFVRRDRIRDLWPLMPADLGEADDIRKFEDVGTQSPAKFLALGEALAFRETVGVARIEARLKYLRDYWLDPLLEHDRISPLTNRSAAVALATIAVEGIDPGDLRDYLWQRHRIRVRPIKQSGVAGIRVSAGLHTTLPELDYFVDVMSDVAQHGI